MRGNGQKQSRKMELFIAALLIEGSIERAAHSAGIGVATAWRWHSMKEFQAELKSRQKEITEHVVTSIKSAMSEALEVLRSIMSDAENPASARVAAARSILDNGFKAIETADILTRLEALESTLEERQKS